MNSERKLSLIYLVLGMITLTAIFQLIMWAGRRKNERFLNILSAPSIKKDADI